MEKGVKREERMEQGVFDQFSGKNITGEFAEEARRDLQEKLEKLLENSVDEILQEKDANAAFKAVEADLDSAVKEYFNSMKGATNLTPEKAKENFKEIIKAYADLFEELKKIGREAERLGLTYEITREAILSFESGWQSELNGFFITFKKDKHLNGTLYAMPLARMKTGKYGRYFVGGEPASADPLKCTDKMLLFISLENMPPDELIGKIKDEMKEIDEKKIKGAETVFKEGSLLHVELSKEHQESQTVEKAAAQAFKDLKEIEAIGINLAWESVKTIIPRKELTLIKDL